MKTGNPIQRILIICIISGLVAGVITNLVFLLIYPSAWLFFLIPAIMGWSIDHYGKIPYEHLHDEETFEKLRKYTGLYCAGMSLLFVLIANIPLFIFVPLPYIFTNLIFYIVCAVSIFVGYNRGQQCIVDAFYDSNLEEE